MTTTEKQQRAVEILTAALQRFTRSTPGRASLMHYYHEEAQCEGPDNCEHCLTMKQARAAQAAAADLLT